MAKPHRRKCFFAGYVSIFAERETGKVVTNTHMDVRDAKAAVTCLDDGGRGHYEHCGTWRLTYEAGGLHTEREPMAATDFIRDPPSEW